MNVSYDLKSKLRKMELKKHLIICWVVLLAFCSGAQGISCYSCDTITDGKNCDDPFVDGTVKKNCTSCFTLKGEVSGVKGIARDCETETDLTTGCNSFEEDIYSGTLCVCTTDLCNDATRGPMATIMLNLLPVLVYIFLKLFEM
ncbi:uncharacterized protein LOC128221215 [Mya arenaria]|uniref:uncharacterized protein LOC128221215 n=1 Tax=Mya arenaria TaxID=6604 RepID=UPI0022E93407|nr:uncharacterized protein LOC128221215 [Mya arenaria]